MPNSCYVSIITKGLNFQATVILVVLAAAHANPDNYGPVYSSVSILFSEELFILV